jgi:ABC-type polar amino acid transport system ATPase subunit
VVVVTHDRAFAEAVAGRTVALDRGRLVSEPAPAPDRTS